LSSDNIYNQAGDLLFNNPFKSIGAALEIIPLINIEYETVNLEIPWLYRSDI